CARICDYW
nr:immunoglobulin heavy chain junction region [Mus musculus]